MAGSRAASTLCIIAGIFYVIGGFVGGAILIGFLVASSYVNQGLTPPTASEIVAQNASYLILGTIAGLVTGTLIIIGGMMLTSDNPKSRRRGGFLAAIAALVGSVNTLGGLFLGFILAMTGSFIGIRWTDPNAPVVVSSARMCGNCGTTVNPNMRFCPQCGKEQI
jgi:zinc-ribbon domain